MTLGPHAFYWFLLTEARDTAEVESGPPVLPAAPDLDRLLRSRPTRTTLMRVLPPYIRARRWFGSKTKRIREVRLVDHVLTPGDGLDAAIALVEVVYTEGDPETYVLPLALGSDRRAREVVGEWPQAWIATVGDADGPLLYDAAFDPRFDELLLAAIAGRRRGRSASTGRTGRPSDAGVQAPARAGQGERQTHARSRGAEQHVGDLRRPAHPQALPARGEWDQPGCRDRASY